MTTLTAATRKQSIANFISSLDDLLAHGENLIPGKFRNDVQRNLQKLIVDTAHRREQCVLHGLTSDTYDDLLERLRVTLSKWDALPH